MRECVTSLPYTVLYTPHEDSLYRVLGSHEPFLLLLGLNVSALLVYGPTAAGSLILSYSTRHSL